LAVGILAVAGLAPAVQAQGPTTGPRYFPLDQNTPPGVAGQWTTAARRNVRCGLQPIRVELPGEEGTVSFYPRPDGSAVDVPAPAYAEILLGNVYRLKISDLPDFPGVALYPTVELLDRLHPPAGRELEFPIPITITAEEIQAVLDGRMVTKVIYLEQPDRADATGATNAARTQLASPRENILRIADEAGRPMVILRMGGRTPDPRQPDPMFFGYGAPIQFPAAPARESRP
jgi:hypothetical protein